MKVGIIGAGFGGLALAYRLAKKGVEVVIFEADSRPGGLAIGFQEPNWQWSLERHYHHWFTSDWSVRNLAKEIGQQVMFIRPKTSTLIGGKIKQLDSPTSLLMFEDLPFVDRVRMGLVLFYLKTTNDWKSLEKVSAKEFITSKMGMKSWQTIWEPLFKGKFDRYLDGVSAAWFWARIKKRSSSLGYPVGGFLEFAQNISKSLESMGVKVYYGTQVDSLHQIGENVLITARAKDFKFDKVVSTLPAPLFIKIARNLPKDYTQSLLNLTGIGAINLVLSLKKPFLTDGTYWLNVDKKQFPFLALVEHTNFMDPVYYNNEHIVYVGNYLEHSHDYFKYGDDELFFEYLPYLKKINPDFSESWVNKKYMFKAFFAQPIYTLNYSKTIPPFETPLKGVYLCNIQQVYPWDRGTNYAVENGEIVADLILKG